MVVDRALAADHPRSRLVMTLHDQLLVEAPGSEADAVQARVIAEMEAVDSLRVPLIASASRGHNWAFE